MVYRRFYRRKFRRIRPRTSFRRRRTFRRFRAFRKRPVKAMHRVLSFTRYGATAKMDIKSISGVNQSGGWTFQLNQIATYGDFAALFDDYKLNAVVIKFRWDRDAPDAEDITATTCPIMHYAIDYNDATTPLSVTGLKEYGSYKAWYMNKAGTHTVKLYPKAQSASYRTAVTTAYGPRKGWINMQYPDVPHYAFKYWIDGSQGGDDTGENTLGVLNWEVKYYFQVKTIN